MSIWTSRVGKFKKKDPSHGWLWKWIKDNWTSYWKASPFRQRGNCKNKCKCKK